MRIAFAINTESGSVGGAPLRVRPGPRLTVSPVATLDRRAGQPRRLAYDLLQRFTRPFARYRHAIAQETEPCFTDSEIGVVCLNAVRRWAPEPDWSHGVIRRSQIARTEARLAAMPEHLFKIVLGHHPFRPPPWDEEARLVGRADLALAAFRCCGVGLTLAGHLAPALRALRA